MLKLKMEELSGRAQEAPGSVPSAQKAQIRKISVLASLPQSQNSLIVSIISVMSKKEKEDRDQYTERRNATEARAPLLIHGENSD
jgi:hypothetical protein